MRVVHEGWLWTVHLERVPNASGRQFGVRPGVAMSGRDYKCIQHYGTGKVTRVLRDMAQALVNTGDFRFVPRSVWKEHTRDAQPQVEAQEDTI